MFKQMTFVLLLTASFSAHSFFSSKPKASDPDCVQKSSIGWCMVDAFGLSDGADTATKEEADKFSNQIGSLSTGDFNTKQNLNTGISAGVALIDNVGVLASGNIVGAITSATGIAFMGNLLKVKKPGEKFQTIFTFTKQDFESYWSGEMNSSLEESYLRAFSRVYESSNPKFETVQVKSIGNESVEVRAIKFEGKECKNTCYAYVPLFDSYLIKKYQKVLDIGGDYWGDGRVKAVNNGIIRFLDESMKVSNSKQISPEKMLEFTRHMDGMIKVYVPRPQGREKSGLVFDGKRIEYVVAN